MIVRKKESAPVDPPKKPLAGPRVDQPAPSNPLPTPQPFIRPDFFTREQVEAARDAQARKFATPATGKIEGEGLIDVVVPVVAAPIAKAIVKPLAAAFSKTATKLADDVIAPIAKKMEQKLQLPQPKAISPDMPLTAAPSDQSKKVVGVLSNDNVYENISPRIDRFQATEEVPYVLPDFLEMDGKIFPRNPDVKSAAGPQVAFVLEYNRKLKKLNKSNKIIPIEQINENIEVTPRVEENVKQLRGLGVLNQKTNDADRLLLDFYQKTYGSSAVNRIESAYEGLSEHLKDKASEIILKQPKTKAPSTSYTGRKMDHMVKILDKDFNVISQVKNKDLKAGDIFKWDTLISNSLSEDSAYTFPDTMFEITSDKGLSILNMNVAKDIAPKEFPGLIDEVENILYKDAVFRVDEILTDQKSKSGFRYKVTLMNPKVLIPAFVTLKLNQNSDESEE